MGPTTTITARKIATALVLLLVALVTTGSVTQAQPPTGDGTDSSTFWNFVVKDATGRRIVLHAYGESKAVLVVNVASACGYTEQNYRELQTLYEKYHPHGLEILAFPCNQFGEQEPNDEPEILQFVQEKFHVTFPVLGKVDVNGPNEDPLFKYLKKELTGFVTNDIKWNFTKFLVVDGVPTKRYSTTTSPLEFEADIVKALGLTESSDEL